MPKKIAMNHLPKLIVFDWDGTLVDSSAYIVSCVRQGIDALGKPIPSDAEIRNVIGLGLDEAIVKLLPDWSDSERLALKTIYRDVYVQAWEKNQSRDQLFPGVTAVLDQLLAKGYTLAVATGKSRKGLDRAMSALALNCYFSATRTADETVSKPHPQMLHELLDELSFNQTEALMVGDTEYDLEMAKNANVPSVGVSYGVHAKERLAPFNPVTIIDEMSELLTWLDTVDVDKG